MYINKEYCITKSEGGSDAPFNPTGSGEWYVDGTTTARRIVPPPRPSVRPSHLMTIGP